MIMILHVLAAIAFPCAMQLTLSGMSIKVHQWLDELGLIKALVVRSGCEIGRNMGGHVLQIADEYTVSFGRKRAKVHLIGSLQVYIVSEYF